MQQEICAGGFCRSGYAYYNAPMGGAFATKIKHLRYQLGLNQTELAERLGVTQASVSRWEKGSLPDAHRMAQLAEMAGESVGTFISGSISDPAKLNRFWVRGAVAAGVWRVAYEWPQDDWFPYSGVVDAKVPDEARYGLRVNGESMNQVYPPGTVLDCVKIEHVPELRSGQRVIVERHKADGAVEATVKEYLKDDGGREWLIPRSNRPEFQVPIAANDPGEGITEVRVVALVIGSYRPE
jgi:transcriptional regulator with XRE-family HTH domain